MKKKGWAYLYMPLLFFIAGYGILYIVLAPVLTVVTSTVNLLVLNEAPTFKEKKVALFDETKKVEPAQNTSETIPSSKVNYPSIGDEYGQLVIEKLGIKSAMTFGDRPEDLRVGVGHYNGSIFPGEVGTTLIGGHNTTDLATLNLIEKGDKITVFTHYGTYVYQVNDTKEARFDDVSAIESVFKREGHHLILYTCSPVEMIGLTDVRLFVYAELQSGPLIDPEN